MQTSCGGEQSPSLFYNYRSFSRTIIGKIFQQSSEKYFNNRRKSIELFMILVYNMSNTN